MRVRPLRRKNAPYVAPPSPAWLTGLAVNEWAELAGTSLSSMGASSGQQDAWCGWVCHPTTGQVYSPGQGGHGDSSDNAMLVCDLRDDVPAWAVVLATSDSGTVDFDSDYGSDGRPKSIHGYNTGVYSPQLDKIIRFPGGSKATSGNPYQKITAFYRATGAWDVEATWTSLSAPTSLGANQGAYAIHPTTGAVLCWFYNHSLRIWVPESTLAFTELISFPSNPAASGTAASIDATMGDEGTAFFLGGGSGGTMCRAYDIATNTLRTITLTGTDISGSATGCGMFFCPPRNEYIVRLRETSGGGTVYAISPTTGTSWACAAITTTGGSGIPATNAELGGDAPYTKFLYDPLHGCAVYGPKWSANVWPLKLHEV